MALVHLNQLTPAPAPAKPAPEPVSTPQPPASAGVGSAAAPHPPVPSPSPSACWGVFSQRLFDKLDAVERTVGSPPLGGGPVHHHPDRT